MTNLFLTIVIATNVSIAKIYVQPVTNTHIYAIEVSTNLVNTNDWHRGWIFLGDDKGTNQFFGNLQIAPAVFYKAVDEGTNF